MPLTTFAVQNVSREGKYAIDSPGGAVLRDLPAEYYNIGKLPQRIPVSVSPV